MNILALDASGLTCSVAIGQDDKIIGEYSLNYTRTHSVTLLPLIDKLIEDSNFKDEKFDYIATAGGPGSFTGLRIGAATAKGLAFSWEIPIISVPTVDALAYNMWGTDGIIVPLMDARRQQTYTGIYRFAGVQEDSEKTAGCRGNEQAAIDREDIETADSDLTVDKSHKRFLEVLHEEYATDIGSLVSEIEKYDEPVTFLGDGVPVFKDYLKEHLKNDYYFAPGNLCRQRASSVALLAYQYALEGKIQSAAEHRPIYLRETQAERERKAKEKCL